MKTEREIEQMKIDIQNEMQEVRVGCFKAWDEGKAILSKELHIDYTKLVAQYNILLEVLR